MLPIGQDAINLAAFYLHGCRLDFPALDGINDLVPLEKDAPPVVVRICRDVLQLTIPLIDFLLDGHPVCLSVRIIIRIDDLLLDCAQNRNLILNAAFCQMQHIGALFGVFIILSERPDTHAHLL